MPGEVRVALSIDTTDATRSLERAADAAAEAGGDFGAVASAATAASGDLSHAGAGAADAASGLEEMSAAATEASDDLGEAGSSAKGYSDRVGNIGAAAAGMSAALGDAGGTLQSMIDIQDRGANRARDHARALAAVDQAGLDTAQALADVKDAQLALTESLTAGKQAVVDQQQAQLDMQQAAIDAQVAQQDYNAAVQEFGPNSVEARQAQLDLAQAASDSEQAQIDLETATTDAARAIEDGEQANRDADQAQRSAKDSAMDLADAQREAKVPTGVRAWAQDLEAVAPVMAGLVGITNLLALANLGAARSWLQSTAAAVANQVATTAVSVATKTYAAIQWLLNAAMAANPIGAVIAAVVALIAGIVLLWKNSETFRNIVIGAWSAIKDATVAVFGGIKDAIAAAMGWVKDKIQSAVSALVNIWSGIAALPQKALELKDSLLAIFASAPKWLLKAGEDMIQGFIDGIKNMWSKVISFLTDQVKKLPDWIKGPLGISSPSTVFADIGADLIGGLLVGMEDMVPTLKRGLTEVTGLIEDGIAPDVPPVHVPFEPAIGSSALGGAAGTAVYVTVNVPPTVDPAEVGRQVVKTIRAYESSVGRTVLAPV